MKNIAIVMTIIAMTLTTVARAEERRCVESEIALYGILRVFEVPAEVRREIMKQFKEEVKKINEETKLKCDKIYKRIVVKSLLKVIK